MIDYNTLLNLKNELEEIYCNFNVTHTNLLKLIEDGECFDDDKIEILYSYIKEYESKILILKADFLLLDAENKKIESCYSEARLLKKRRLTTLQSRMDKRNIRNDEDEDLPF